MASYRIETKQPQAFGLAYRNDLSGSVQYIGEVEDTDDDRESLIDGRTHNNRDEVTVQAGLELLRSIDRFTLQQVVDRKDAWSSLVSFRVEDGRGDHLFDLKEIKSSGSFLRGILGMGRHYYMKVIDVNQNTCLLELEHPLSCGAPALCPWSAPTMTARMPTGEVLGQIRHSNRETCGSCFPPSSYFDLFDDKGELLYSVQGPGCHPCECTIDSVASFQLMKQNPNQKNSPEFVGEVNHIWRGPCGGCLSWCVTSETDRASITFSRGAPVQEKALFIGLLVLLTSIYWEVQ
ncbi:uncharacterized protein LOC116616315 [Nematostella vectensis]|uniref:uncharacterized protein LOC116616315 n=1 Tax=Nematostella vectensis TaxID=45351 RepID=UPI0013902011|nr:uncharacterized protein LOC116616315 [Nematostella vectensis]